MIKEENLPKNWELVKIEDIAHTITDYVANGSFASLRENVKYKEKEDYAILIRLKDHSKKFKEPFVYIDQHAYDFLSKTKLKNNDLILSNVGARLGTVFRVPNLNKPMSLGPNAILIRTNDSDDYLNYWLRSTFGQKSIFNIRSESAQPKFNKTSLRKIKIPVPPLETQKKIVEILEKAEKLKEWRTEADKLADDYLKIVFLEMFDHPLSQSDWQIKNLEKLTKGKNGLVDGPFGSSVNTKVDYVNNGEIPVIRTKNVNDFQFIEEDLKYMAREKFETVKRSAVYPGDIILTKVGTIGNLCIFPNKYKEAVLSTTGSCKITVDDKIVNSIYLMYYLELYKPKMLQIASTGVQPFLNMKHIKGFKIKLPPITLQNQFAQIVQQVETLKTHQSKSKQEIDNLFNTVMQKAFKGELIC